MENIIKRYIVISTLHYYPMAVDNEPKRVAECDTLEKARYIAIQQLAKVFPHPGKYESNESAMDWYFKMAEFLEQSSLTREKMFEFYNGLVDTEVAYELESNQYMEIVEVPMMSDSVPKRIETLPNMEYEYLELKQA
jgi:hypothetical protein